MVLVVPRLPRLSLHSPSILLTKPRLQHSNKPQDPRSISLQTGYELIAAVIQGAAAHPITLTQVVEHDISALRERLLGRRHKAYSCRSVDRLPEKEVFE